MKKIFFLLAIITSFKGYNQTVTLDSNNAPYRMIIPIPIPWHIPVDSINCISFTIINQSASFTTIQWSLLYSVDSTKTNYFCIQNGILSFPLDKTIPPINDEIEIFDYLAYILNIHYL